VTRRSPVEFAGACRGRPVVGPGPPGLSFRTGWYNPRASQVAAAVPRRDALREPARRPSRKVRTPQSRALANGQPGKPEGKRNREQTASGLFGGAGKGETVR